MGGPVTCSVYFQARYLTYLAKLQFCLIKLEPNQILLDFSEMNLECNQSNNIFILSLSSIGSSCIAGMQHSEATILKVNKILPRYRCTPQLDSLASAQQRPYSTHKYFKNVRLFEAGEAVMLLTYVHYTLNECVRRMMPSA